MNIGDRIKSLRVCCGLSQRVFAEKIKISRGALVNYEKSERIPPLNVIQSIADFFNITIGDVIGENITISCKDAESIKESPIFMYESIGEVSSEDISLNHLKNYLKSLGYPIESIGKKDIKSLHNSCSDFVKFEMYKLGYLQIDNK